MLNQKTGKVILISLAVLLVLALILYFSLKKDSGSQALNGQYVVPSDESNLAGNTGSGSSSGSANQDGQKVDLYPNARESAEATVVALEPPVPSVSASPNTSGRTIPENSPLGSKQYVEPANPYPGSGYLDYTWRDHTITDLRGTDFEKKTPCELTNLSSSWSNPLEKFLCDSINLFSTKIVDQLYELNCMFAATSLQDNVSEGISWEYKNSECRIIDR